MDEISKIAETVTGYGVQSVIYDGYINMIIGALMLIAGIIMAKAMIKKVTDQKANIDNLALPQLSIVGFLVFLGLWLTIGSIKPVFFPEAALFDRMTGFLNDTK